MDQDLPIPGPRTKAALALLERHRRRGVQPLQRPQTQPRPMTVQSPLGPRDPAPRTGPACSTISEVSRQLGLTLRTIRLYEDMGLIECERGYKNMRILTASTQAKLGTIVELKRLGLAISEIVVLLADDGGPSPEIRSRLEARLLSLDQQRDAIVSYLSRLKA
ncbi:MerR family transcriptional regulator [Caulobacter soli]|uniref:MerR family transcriptional regulator n=1 Tax=Caulobacter soli TaxID=2708539 RepID=UPI0013EAB89F|nr:MerR family transcriptional regulator [Caulobacter soli]